MVSETGRFYLFSLFSPNDGIGHFRKIAQVHTSKDLDDGFDSPPKGSPRRTELICQVLNTCFERSAVLNALLF